MSNPLSEHALFREAESLLRTGDYEKIDRALGIYEEVSRQHPGNPKSWFERAGAYDYLGKEDIAVTFYEDVLRLGPEKLSLDDQPRFYLQFGSTLRNLKRYEESRKLLEKGIVKYPDFTALSAFLGLTEYTDGNFKKASDLLLNALVADPEDRSVQEYIRALKGYRDTISHFPEPPIRNGSLDHVELYVSNLESSYLFWSKFLKALGYEDFQNWGEHWSGGRSFKRDMSYVVLVQAEEKHQAQGYHRKRIGLNHLAFRARSKSEVDRISDLMKQDGFLPLYSDRESQPEKKDTHAIFLEDPDRIKVELVCK
jgi:tetratricopeptide (TPR) repeat protein